MLDHGTYFDQTTRDLAVDLRKDTVRALKRFGIQVEYSHHEVGPSQHEIDLRYAEALKMADNVMTYRAGRQGGRAAQRRLRDVHAQADLRRGRQRHARAPVAVQGRHATRSTTRTTRTTSRRPPRATSPASSRTRARSAPSRTSGSTRYKRLVSGYEAPVYICWAHRNRSALVRVPMYKPGKENATRVELRSPDPACNPYLAFSVMLAAGLDGIEKGLDAARRRDRRRLRDDRGASAPRAASARCPGDLDEAIVRDGEERAACARRSATRSSSGILRNKTAEWMTTARASRRTSSRSTCRCCSAAAGSRCENEGRPRGAPFVHSSRRDAT